MTGIDSVVAGGVVERWLGDSCRAVLDSPQVGRVLAIVGEEPDTLS